MHSNIYGIIDKDSYDKKYQAYGRSLELYYNYESLPHFADYVDDVSDKEAEFNWLLEHFKSHGVDPSLFVADSKQMTLQFKLGFKTAYFRESWENLIKCVLNPKAYEDFCGLHGGGLTDRIQRNIEETYGFYVADEYSGYQTLDSFIRTVKEDKTYLVFDIKDYHF